MKIQSQNGLKYVTFEKEIYVRCEDAEEHIKTKKEFNEWKKSKWVSGV